VAIISLNGLRTLKNRILNEVQHTADVRRYTTDGYRVGSLLTNFYHTAT